MQTSPIFWINKTCRELIKIIFRKLVGVSNSLVTFKSIQISSKIIEIRARNGKTSYNFNCYYKRLVYVIGAPQSTFPRLKVKRHICNIQVLLEYSKNWNSLIYRTVITEQFAPYIYGADLQCSDNIPSIYLKWLIIKGKSGKTHLSKG